MSRNTQGFTGKARHYTVGEYRAHRSGPEGYNVHYGAPPGRLIGHIRPFRCRKWMITTVAGTASRAPFTSIPDALAAFKELP